MSVVNRSIDVAFSPSQMYALVNAIEYYPQFLPWCKTSQVLSRTDDEVKATLTLSSHGMSKSFTTLNRLQADKMIEVRLVNGPFKHLEGFWCFEPLADGHCRITLDMEFEFSSTLISMALGPIFNQVVSTLVDAFCQRAVEVYAS